MEDDEEACAECGEYFPPDDLVLGICEDCHDADEEELRAAEEAHRQLDADHRFWTRP